MLRASTFLLAFASAAALAAARRNLYILLDQSAFKYNFAVATIVCFYSAIQLLKDIRDCASIGFLLSAEKSDKICFILDQILAYLLLSSSSVSIQAIRAVTTKASRHVAIASTCLSFAAFSAIAISAIMSGYRLCKRIIW